MMTACKSTNPTSEKSTRAESAQTQLKKREAECVYTKQTTYISLWQKNQSQQNLIESLKKRIAMLQDRMTQKDGAAGPIPNMIVEPSTNAETSTPYDKCMNNQKLKSAGELTKENKNQESQIHALHKKATDLSLELQSKR
ncbi:hypothetical protein GCM10011613_15140 [Cellvibrio zantedeschiae]|uniref:Uncharacterized protein n=2 Tax=Cellvibrio zantedeschiae TaxID=1237077 RepID=A0ABQ3B109_9GAMM|nr:hypothetical protein GCM10011613_15140 [Cellvibrio zantedeschiae]